MSSTSESSVRTPDVCLTDLLQRQFLASPNAIAVVYDDAQMTYAELASCAKIVANNLLAAGITRGQLVGVAMERSLEMVVALVGILEAGAAYVPIDPDYPAERLAYMLRDSQATIVLTKKSVLGKLTAPHATTICLEINDLLSKKPGAPHVSADLSSIDPAYVIYTSGSTGMPKGVVVSHGAICNQLLWMQETYQLTASDRFLQKAPFSFDISVFELFWPLIGGGQIILARPGGQSDPAYLVALIQKSGVTLLDFLPSMLEAFLLEPGVENCQTLRQVLVGGELISQKLVDRFSEVFPIPIDNVYGPTETTIQVTRWVCQSGANLPRVPIGLAVANTQLYVLNLALQPTPPEIAGEIYVGGRQLASGYWRLPDLTAASFIKDPFSDDEHARLYKTGDLGYFDAAGVLYFLGRADEQIKLRGHRLELRGIAVAMEKHWAVREAVAVLREDRPGDQRLVIYFLGEKGIAQDSLPTQMEFKKFLALTLPDYSIPSACVALEEWPLLPNGKIDRAAFPAPKFVRLNSIENLAPMSRLEEQLAAIWREILGVEKVGVEEDFFDLGGDSLLGLQLVTRIREKFGNRSSIAALFESSTIRAMARCLDDGDGTDEATGAYLILHHDLAALWLRFLPVTQMNVQDGFFDLGGNDAAARAMLAEVEHQFQTPLGLEPFARQPTIEWLAATILQTKQKQPLRKVNPLIETGVAAPFFYLHGDMTGVGFYCRKLARLLGNERPFYTMSPIDYRQAPWQASIRDMAEKHVADLLAMRPTGPYVIGGFCSAAIVAFEVAHILRNSGHKVEKLILLEAEWAHPMMRAWHWWNNRGSIPNHERLAAFSKGWGTMEKWRAFQEMNQEDQMAWIGRKFFFGKPLAMPEQSAADAEWLNEYGEGPLIAAWAECGYHPKCIDVAVELILSDDTLVRRETLLAAWEGLAPSLRTHFLPGSHHGMITNGAEALARTFREILRECD